MKHKMINYKNVLEKNIQLHYIQMDAFVLILNRKDNIEVLQNLEDSFDFNILRKDH